MDERETERLADEYVDWILDRVEGDAEKGWSVDAQGIGYFVRAGSPVEPKVGMRARFYGRGFGYPVHGLLLDNTLVFYKTRLEREADAAEFKRKYDEKHARAMAESWLPETQRAGFEWTDDMRQISGFGGSYERACRSMVSAGCKWWSEHPEAHPTFHGFKGITGVVLEDNEDAKALTKAVIDAAGGDATGAMHEFSLRHVFAWHALGSWAAYQAEMRQPLADVEEETA
jgi:hypothetical protein